MFKRRGTGAYSELELAPSLSRPRPKVQASMTTHGVRDVAAERLGHGSVRKASVGLLSKDAEIRECTQQSIQGRSVKIHGRSYFFGCFRSALNLIG